MLFNFSLNKNTINSLDADGGVESLQIAQVFGDQGPTIEARTGSAYGEIMGWDFIYDPVSGKKVLDGDGRPYSTVTRVPLGNVTPDWLAGMVNTVTFGDFSFSLLLDAKIGGDTWFGTKGTADGFGQSKSFSLW